MAAVTPASKGKRKKDVRTMPSSSRRRREDRSISAGESYTDFSCVICRELLYEPVVLPCSHEFCCGCFKPYLEVTSLCCPICNERISIWVRKEAKHNPSLVNKERWNYIKENFPERVEKRRLGFDDDTDADADAPPRIIAADGDVRKDYLLQLEDVEKEKAEELRRDLEFARQVSQEDLQERMEQEQKDRETAMAWQEEEVGNLGVTLTSPTEHQRKLLQMYKPKAPMILRTSKAVNSRFAPRKKQKKVSIKKYFPVNENTDPADVAGSSKDDESAILEPFHNPDLHVPKDVDPDYEMALRLQRELNSSPST